MYKPLKMFGASSNFNPYGAQNQGGHGGHGHGHGGHGHSHTPGEQCSTSVDSLKTGNDDISFPSPGPLNKPAAAAGPPPPSKLEPTTMSIVQAVQYGEIDKLKEFIENGADVRKPDAENVTLLHWAAINNRIDIVKYLITSGAIVDQKGGNLDATPLHWAVRQGLLNMVVLLMQYGADSHSMDIEGCTCLHVACQLSQTAVAAYLIAKGMDVDLLDTNGMTPLMWVAYRSFGNLLKTLPVIVDTMRLLLTMGASLNRRDKFHKNTALHWAVISSNHNGLSALCKASADTTIKNEKGETSLDLANQKKSIWMVTQLEYLNLNEGHEQPSWLRSISTNKTSRARVMFWLPFYTLFSTAAILEWSSGWSCFMLMISTLLITWGSVRLFYNYDLNSNPVALAIAISTKALSYSVCAYFILSFAVFSTILFYSFYKSWKTDPGVLISSHGERKRVIVELAEKGILDFKSFCSTCLIRRPIRSKHCSVCGRCVARMDHHCPWVDNCVGVDNHVSFVVYLFSIIVCFIYVMYASFLFFSEKCHAFDNGAAKGITAMFQCSGMVSWTLMLAIFFVFWVIALFVSQCHQVFWRGMTTNEVINAPRYEHFFSSTNDGMPNSPFSRGLVGNIADFFQCSFCGFVRAVHVDWKTEFDYEKYARHGKRTV